jgi:hypothetical protein
MRPAAVPTRLALAFAALSLLPPAAVAAPDGALDTTYSGDGVYGAFGAYVARAAATLPDQGTAVVGALSIAPEPLVDWVKLSTTPTLTDCGAGIFSLASFEGRAVLVDRGGNLVVAGVATFSGAPSQEVALVSRFPAGGCSAFDGTWSGAGWEALDDESFCDTEDCLVVDLAEAPTNAPKLYALVESRVNFLTSRFFVVAFQANGALDTAFGSNGYAEVAATGLGTLVPDRSHLTVTPSGSPLVFGTRWDPAVGLDADPFLLSFSLTGTPGPPNVIRDSDTVDDYAADVVVGADGLLAYGGNVPAETYGWWVAQRPDGTTPSASVGDHELVALAPQGDGKLLVVLDALAADEVEVQRYLTGPGSGPLALDTDFGAGGSVSFDSTDTGLGGTGEDCQALVLSTGRPLIVCNRHFSGGDGGFFLRLINRHVFADGFELGSRARWRWAAVP